MYDGIISLPSNRVIMWSFWDDFFYRFRTFLVSQGWTPAFPKSNIPIEWVFWILSPDISFLYRTHICVTLESNHLFFRNMSKRRPSAVCQFKQELSGIFKTTRLLITMVTRILKKQLPKIAPPKAFPPKGWPEHLLVCNDAGVVRLYSSPALTPIRSSKMAWEYPPGN